MDNSTKNNNTTLGHQIEQNASGEQRGEVDNLIERTHMSVANLEQEFEMLFNRLRNVVRQEPMKAIEPTPEQTYSTELGLRLADAVTRTDGVARAIRQLREMLGN